MKNLKEAKKENIIIYFKDLKNITSFLNQKEVKEFIEELKHMEDYDIHLGKPFEQYLDYFYNIENNLLKMFNEPKYLEFLSSENMLERIKIFINTIKEYRKDTVNKKFKNFVESYKSIAGFMKNLMKEPEETRREFILLKKFPELHQEFLNDLKKLKEGKMKKRHSIFKEWKRKKAILTETAKKILGKDDIVLEYFMKKSINKYLKENNITLEKLSKDDYEKIQADPELAPYMDMYGSPSKEKEEMGKRVGLSDKLQQKIAENGIDLNSEELEMFLKHFDRMVRNKKENL